MKKIKITIKWFNDVEEREKAHQFAVQHGLKAFSALSPNGQGGRPPEGEYTLDLAHVFSNQYNTVEDKLTGHKGYRVFEFYDPLVINYGRTVHSYYGYYISEGIEKIREYQRELKVCGYCGKQYYKSAKLYCNSCLGSQYLEEKYYPFLRLRNILDDKPDNTTPLPTKIVNLIAVAQRKSREKRLAQQKADKIASIKAQIRGCKAELKGFQWLIAHDIPFDNVIYYTHSGKFNFGWRNCIAREEAAKLRLKLEGFPYAYEITEEK